MPTDSYRLHEQVGPFEPGQVLAVKARFGDWHRYDLKLEAVHKADDRSIELTEAELDSVADPISL